MKNSLIREMRKITTTISPRLSNRIMYRAVMKKKLNITEPKTFNEKINWLKINAFPHDKLVIQCADKFAVREYVVGKNCGQYLNEIIGDWNDVDEIPWDTLPQQFVLKCNHGCGYNIICPDKGKFDKEKAICDLRRWMKEDFGKVTSELHYSKIKKKIICEKFLENDILDYKFFCFDGEPKFFYISQNVEGDFHDMQADFFYPHGEKADFSRTDHIHFSSMPAMPYNLLEMLDIARKLSTEFPFVRVDLFNVNNVIYFSELTFTPSSGFMPLAPEGADEKIGTLLDLERYPL